VSRVEATTGRSTLGPKRAAVALALLAVLVTPTVWSLTPALKNIASDLPVAGATTMVGNADPTNATDAKLIAYLEANQGTATYLVATPSSNAADTIILATGKPVMALGGFTGTDPILTSAQLQALIAAGKVRYFLLNGGNTRAGIASSGSGSGASSAVINVGGPNGNTNTAVLWVEQNCATVATSAWQSSTSGARATGGGVAGMGGAQQLYDCAAK
jgi:4-amino-4-deoxy-L-arabinose transferase-like glycosyltransferase